MLALLALATNQIKQKPIPYINKMAVSTDYKTPTKQTLIDWLNESLKESGAPVFISRCSTGEPIVCWRDGGIKERFEYIEDCIDCVAFDYPEADKLFRHKVQADFNAYTKSLGWYADRPTVVAKK